MSESSVPKAQDLVLGGKMPPPVSGAVLGGLVGLQQRFQQSELAQKLAALEAAVTYGAEAIPLLQQGLEAADLTVRSTAYSQLKKLGVLSPDLDRGIPLKVGDRIYAVYESSLSYGDDWYYIDAEINEDYQEDHPFYHPSKDIIGNIFEYVSDAPKDNLFDPYYDYCNPRLIAYYPNFTAAEIKAQVVYEEKFGKMECEIYEIYPPYEPGQDNESEEEKPSDASNLRDWIEANRVLVDAKLPENWDDDWTYEVQVMMSLRNQKQFSLLRELWQQKGYEALAFVHEHVIDRPCYLRLHTLET